MMLDAGSARPARKPIRHRINCAKGLRHMSYKNLDVWQLAREMTTEIHGMTMRSLPKHEMYEVGSQIRRSAKSVRSNIVEGYGRRRYKQEFIRFLTYVLSSCDETRDHLEVLYETDSLNDVETYRKLAGRLEELGKKLNNLITSVERDHRSVREDLPPYAAETEGHAERCDEYPASSTEHLASKNEKPH